MYARFGQAPPKLDAAVVATSGGRAPAPRTRRELPSSRVAVRRRSSNTIVRFRVCSPGGGLRPAFGGHMEKGVAAASGFGSGSVEPVSTQPTPSRTPAFGSTAPGIDYARFFTREGIDPFDEIEWDLRAAVIGNEKGA